MDQKGLERWLKTVITGVALVGAVLYFVAFPMIGRGIVGENPEMANRFWPWLIFLWMTAIPCYLVLVLGWKISAEIGKDNSFSKENAKALKWVSVLAAGDSVFLLAGNLVLLCMSMSHPGVFLASVLIAVCGAFVAVAAAVLSHLVMNAAELKEENRLTI